MPILPLKWRIFTGGIWLKGPRENNPEGTLRRAKSVYPLRTGSVRSRSGSHSFATLTAHSLFKYAGRRIAGVAATIYREVVGVFTDLGLTLSGNPLTFVSAPPTVGKEDFIFMAGSGTAVIKLQKLNPALTAATQWGIDPPSGAAPTAVAGTLKQKEIDDFDATTGWSASVVDDDDTDVTASFPPNLTAVAGKKVEGTASLRFKASKDKMTRLDKLIVTDLTVFDPSGTSADEDYIELYLAFNRPKHIKNMELVFYVGAGAPTFDDESDTYSRELTFQIVRGKKKKKLRGSGDFFRKKDIEQAIRDGRIDKIDFSMAEFVAEDKIGVTRRTWTRVTIPKASFTANGNAGTSGKTWANVQAVRISVECNKQGGSRVWLDRMRIIGGVGMQGDYNYMFTFRNSTTGTRSNPFPKTTDTNGDEIYNPVVIRNIERTGVDLSGLPTSSDTQVDKLEIWRTVGNGTLFFLAAVINEGTTTYNDQVADYPGMFSGGGGTLFLQPEELPDDNDRPNDTLQDAVQFLDRMWLCRPTSSDKSLFNRAFYSPSGRLEAVANYVPVGGTDEATQKFVVWNDTLWLLTTKGLYRLLNTDEPFVFVPVLGAPGTPFPFTVQATPFGIIYQARDGYRRFDGNEVEMLGEDALAPVFRGGTSDGIAAFAGAASTFGRDEYYVGDQSNTTLAWAPTSGWRNVGLASRALFWEVDSRVLLASVTISATTRIVSLEGDSSGETGGLVAETTTDVGGASLASDFELETAGDHKGGGVWGLAQRIYITGQTEGLTLTVSLIVDNTAVSVGTTSLPVGIKRVMELAVHRWGFIQGVRITAASLTKRIEISEIKLDVYVPERPGG